MALLAEAGRGVRVVVPATSANLGPGFDALGLAFAWYDEVEVQIVRADTGGLHVSVSFVVTGEGAEAADVLGEDLVVTTLLTTLTNLGVRPDQIEVRCRNAIPHGRGLGSSAAAIIAGVSAALALVRGVEHVDRAEVIDRSARIEGHADNVAACVLGGFTIAWNDSADETGSDPSAAAQWRATRLEPLSALAPVILIPTEGLPTVTARAALPNLVPHGAAAATAGRASLLVAAITGDLDLLHAATADWLHQPYRAEVMPGTTSLVRHLRGLGLPAVVSGAGPSVLVLHDPAGESEPHAPPGWEVRPLTVDRRGLIVDQLRN